MRAVIQRVSRAEVRIGGSVKDAIGQGLLILLGIEQEDGSEDVEWLVAKIAQMRIFSDPEGKMNLSIQDVAGDMLVISQFTLHARTKKGNRPSFIQAARPEKAIPLYEEFLSAARERIPGKVGSGEFGAMMDIELVNDGPVTIWMDSKNKE
jgi:D-tyrosyl-tRNA(Tyr) deacylase